MPRFLGIGSGKDGTVDLGSYTPVNVSCSGTSGSTSLSATGSFNPGDRLFIHQTRGTGAGLYEDNWVVSYSTGTITLLYPLENTYTDSGASQAQVVVVKESSSVTGSYTQSAWDGDKGGLFVMACSGTFSGTITATGKGYLGATGSNSTDSSGRQGEGTSGARDTVSRNANGNGGGGGVNGDNDRCGGGAGGGYASAGTDGEIAGGVPDAYGGYGGNIVGQANLATGIFMGGGGGEGANGDQGTSGAGGAGGGIIVVYAKSFSNTASLIANGNNGSNSSGAYAGGGGGGAGGTILIKSVSTTIGTSKITSSGGTGGAGTGSAGFEPDGDGGAGSVGRIRIESCSLSGTTSPTASTQTGGHSYCGTNIAIL